MNEETKITNIICPDCGDTLHSTPVYKNWSMNKIIRNNLFCPKMDCKYEKDVRLPKVVTQRKWQ